jgi:hypothetical protein
MGEPYINNYASKQKDSSSLTHNFLTPDDDHTGRNILWNLVMWLTFNKF